MPTKGKDGFYHSKVVPAPGVKPVYFRARTLREFNQRRQQIIEDYRTGKENRSMTFVALAEEWFTVVHKPRVKASTAYQNEHFFRRHILAWFPDQQLARAVRYADLQRCVDHLAGMCSGLSTQAIGTLKQICRYGVAQGVMDVDYSTALRMPKVAKAAPRAALTAAQAAALRSSYAPDPTRIALMLQYYCGLRCGEALALRWEDINFSSARLHVVRQYNKTIRQISDLKTDQSERYVDIPAELVDLLRPLRSLPHLYVCTGSDMPFPYGSFNYYFLKLLLSLGFAHLNDKGLKAQEKAQAQGKTLTFYVSHYDADFTAHNLRHNYATALFRAQVDPAIAMRLLGHSSYNTTLNVYTDIKNMLDDDVEMDDHLLACMKKVANKLQVRRFGTSNSAENH